MPQRQARRQEHPGTTRQEQRLLPGEAVELAGQCEHLQGQHTGSQAGQGRQQQAQQRARSAAQFETGRHGAGQQPGRQWSEPHQHVAFPNGLWQQLGGRLPEAAVALHAHHQSQQSQLEGEAEPLAVATSVVAVTVGAGPAHQQQQLSRAQAKQGGGSSPDDAEAGVNQAGHAGAQLGAPRLGAEGRSVQPCHPEGQHAGQQGVPEGVPGNQPGQRQGRGVAVLTGDRSMQREESAGGGRGGGVRGAGGSGFTLSRGGQPSSPTTGVTRSCRETV